MTLALGGAGRGIAFLVAAGTMAEFIAKACSSPQTTELNADKRAPTLMKWVHLGLLEGIFFVGAAMYLDPEYKIPFLLGGAAEAVITYAQYAHAKQAGLANGGARTEQY